MFKESYKTPVNLEDLNIDFDLQHFKLSLFVKAMKKLTRNLIEEDSSQCLKILS